MARCEELLNGLSHPCLYRAFGQRACLSGGQRLAVDGPKRASGHRGCRSDGGPAVGNFTREGHAEAQLGIPD
eukprot:10619091-Alexandrium_andersonii.AAC.1